MHILFFLLTIHRKPQLRAHHKMEKIGIYTISETLYSTNKSSVYRAVRDSDQCNCILKVAVRNLSAFNYMSSFRKQYEILKGLKIDGVIEAIDYFEYEGMLVIAFLDIGGISLRQHSQAASVTVEEFFEISIGVATILGRIQEKGLVHRDINSANIIINPKTRQLQIIDFGTACNSNNETAINSSVDIIEGTPAYLSPEQTGRVNRAIDYRTDFYSLGITFYELISGAPPFTSDDIMEYIHFHIARMPTPPVSMLSDFPAGAASIVMKLIQKNAEERYQTSNRLISDLQRCHDAWLSGKPFDIDSIGSNEASDRLMIPSKIYGREAQTDELVTAFYKTVNEKPVVFLISGCSGIGKSSIVKEILPELTKRNGRLIEGKFEQLKRGAQFAPLINAARHFLQGILSENEERLAMWQDRITQHIGANAPVLVDIIPEIEMVLGTQEKIAQLSASESQNRFNYAFKNLIVSFSTSENPLVLFIDNIQWADKPSLDLIEFIITAPELSHCLFVGSYRDDEIRESMAGLTFVEKMRCADLPFHSINLKGLSIDAISSFLSDMMFLSKDEVLSLADACHGKTEGNPFFLIEFVKDLYQEHLLSFDYSAQRWTWKTDAIENKHITDNVADLLTNKLFSLPPQCIDILKCASCIGNEFILFDLSIVTRSTIVETAGFLNEAIQCGLITNIQSVISLSSIKNCDETDAKQAVCRFVHDRILSTVYGMLDEDLKAEFHERIAILQLKKFSLAEQESAIYEIANQLNKGASAQKKLENLHYAELDLKAGNKAMSVTAFADALEYFRKGIAFLSKDSWLSHYELTLTIYTNATTCSNICAMDDEMELYALEVLTHTKDKVAILNIQEMRINAYATRNWHHKAIELGIKVLSDFGINIPIKPSIVHMLSAVIKMKLLMTKDRKKKLLDLKLSEDPSINSLTNIMTRMATTAYLVEPGLMPIFTQKRLEYTCKYGITPGSISAYAGYGLILCGIFHRYNEGYEFGKIALALLDKLKNIEYRARTVFNYNVFIRHWKEAWQASLADLRDNFFIALDLGDLEYASFVGLNYTILSVLSAGQELSSLQKEADRMTAIMKHYKLEYGYSLNRFMQQVIENLEVIKDEPAVLTGKYADISECKRTFEKLNHINGLCGMAIFRSYLEYLFGDCEKAMGYFPDVKKYFSGVRSTPFVGFFNFVESLIYCSRYPSVSKNLQHKFKKVIRGNQNQLKKMSQLASVNYLQKWYLVEAEYCRVTGRGEKAIGLYELAIKNSLKHSFVNDTALAYERAGDFHRMRGSDGLARYYYTNAVFEYMRWGAISKAQWLRNRYPDLLSDQLGQTGTKSFETTMARTTHVTTQSPTRNIGSSLDMQSILKATGAVNQSLKMESLLKSLITILMENAGAQRCILCLNVSGTLMVQAAGGIDNTVDVFTAVPVETFKEIPISIVNFVKRSHKPVVIADARLSGNFSNDPYFTSHSPRSILCAALMNQNKFSGIYYLENDLSTGAFITEKIEILNIITSQAAIAFENSRLYEQLSSFNAQLEKQVQERTRQLVISQKNITDIMNNIQSAIFTFNFDLTVNEEHSHMAETLFGITTFSTMRLGQLLSLSPENEEYFVQWTKLIHTHTTTKKWAKKEKLSPVRETRRLLKDKEIFLSVNYQPIFEGDKISKVMVIANDITAQKMAEQHFEQSQREKELQLERVQTLVENRAEAIASLLDECDKLMETLQTTSLQNLFAQTELMHSVCRDAHTIKGNSGSYGLTQLPGIIERLENFFSSIKSELIIGQKEDAEYKNFIDDLTGELTAIKNLRKKLFSMRENRISIDKDKYNEILMKISNDSFKSSQELLKEYAALNSLTLELFCQRYNKVIQSYCLKYGKKINPLIITTPQQILSPAMAQHLDGPVTHIVRNCLDHGIESPEIREQSNKSVEGSITFSCTVSEKELHLIISDDGKGLDPDAIAATALRKGFLTEQQLGELSSKQKQELIMMHGFSTKESANEISGRGVGMDAVKSDVEKLGGSVSIASTLGSGSLFTISLPVSHDS